MNSLPMTIDDNLLSAFLDGELQEPQMQAVRAALASDPALAARLEALARVNVQVKQHARALDTRPLPAAVHALLQTDPVVQPASGTALYRPWQDWRPRSARNLALAASIVGVLGFAVTYLNSTDRTGQRSELPALAAYSGLLDSSPSGTVVTTGEITVLNRFSFRNTQNQYCRQYQLHNAAASSENIACRTDQGWNLVANLPVPVQADAAAYQAASTANDLNVLLDTMMQGAALDLATEADLINRAWQDPAAQ